MVLMVAERASVAGMVAMNFANLLVKSNVKDLPTMRVDVTVWVEEVMKLVITGALAKALPAAKGTRPVTLRTVLLCFVTSVLYWAQSVCFWMAFRRMDIASYQVLNTLKLLLTGILKHYVLRRSVTKLQAWSLVLLSVCVVATQVKTDSGFSSLSSVLYLEPVAYLWSFSASILTALASTVLDYVYHNTDSFLVTSSILYTNGVLIRGAIVLFGMNHGSTIDEVVRSITDRRVLTMNLLSASGHFVTGAVVKYHSAVAKSVVAASVIPLAAAYEAFATGRFPSGLRLSGTLGVSLAVAMYVKA